MVCRKYLRGRFLIGEFSRSFCLISMFYVDSGGVCISLTGNNCSVNAKSSHLVHTRFTSMFSFWEAREHCEHCSQGVCDYLAFTHANLAFTLLFTFNQMGVNSEKIEFCSHPNSHEVHMIVRSSSHWWMNSGILLKTRSSPEGNWRATKNEILLCSVHNGVGVMWTNRCEHQPCELNVNTMWTKNSRVHS